MKRVAVTGCSGYIGTRLMEMLEGDPDIESVLGVDIRPPSKAFARLEFKKMDVRDSRLSGLFAERGTTHVVHLAFVVNSMRDEREMHDIDVNGTRNVLKASLACGAAHLTVASSTSAFGAFPDNPEWLSEADHPRRQPDFTYASDKYEVEMMLELFRRENPGVKVAVVRPCIVFGPNVNNYLSSFLLDLPFLPGIGGARPSMQFVHEEDAARVFAVVLKGEYDGIFHAVGKGVVEIEEIARMSGKRIVDFPPWLAYRAVDALWKIRFPLIKGPSGMLNFIRYRWVASDNLTREKLDLPGHVSSREVVRILLESRGYRVR